jgi:putative aminopeptidase FrvX
MKLLKELCAIPAPAGNEVAMTEYILSYVKKNSKKWAVQPVVYSGPGFQDCIVLVFGKPRTAIFAHMDSIGFTVRYDNNVVKIGGPQTQTGIELMGEDSKGKVNCTLNAVSDGKLSVSCKRAIDRGTMLTFKPDWRETKDYVQCCYMDNRLGVWNALKVAETLKDGIIAFSCWEEHGGGSVEYLARFIYEKFNVMQALISDITWVTEGVFHGKGAVISLRDSGLPRRSYVNRIIEIVKKSKIPYQLEVEATGGSDGNALQRSPYPFDWCFIGAPESFVHSPDEKVHKKDIDSMVKMYEALMKKL